MWLTAILSGLALSSHAANTDGRATFSVTTASYAGSYDPDNIAAVWVVDSSNRFVKTLCRHGVKRISHLSQWAAASGSYTNVDGTTSATLTSEPQTHSVTWNCRNTNNLVVPDGLYYFKAEYTSDNGQGPYLTNGVSFMKSTTPVTTNYADFSNGGGQFTGMALAYTPIMPDIAITALQPSSGPINSNVAATVTVTNRTGSATTPFTVTLSDVTTIPTVLIGTQQVASLAASAATNLSFNWSTAGKPAGTYQLKAEASPLASETNLTDNVMTNTINLVQFVHDIAVSTISVSPMVPPNTTTNVIVSVNNAGTFTETRFSISLNDLSASQLIGTRSITSFAPGAATNIVFAWNTTGATVGYHSLQAVAGAVANETLTDNNIANLTVMVANGIETNALIARGSNWQYLDAGLDISGAPWIQFPENYYDGFWKSGPAPLGYGAPAIATTVSYGFVSSNKYITTYFRKEFIMDLTPITVTGMVRKADGVVLYLNGQELDRQNMPPGTPVNAATPASAEITGPDATNYSAFNIAPSNLVVGRNLLAAEVHLSSTTNTGMGFDLEIRTLSGAITRTNAVAPVAIQPDGNIQLGDRLGVSVTLTNRGNVATACTILIRDAATGVILASQSAPLLVAGESTTVHLTWPTLGSAAGTRTLQALTVFNGVTNLAAAVSNTVTIAELDYAPHLASAAGSIGGRCNAVAASGQYVYLGCGSTLEIWDAMTPANPARIGTIRMPGIIEGLAVKSPCVYVAAGESGVHMVDVSNPATPAHVATFDTSGNAQRLTISGTSLFIADGLGGVRVLNIANPGAPVLTSAYQTAGAARSIAYASHNLYVLDMDEGLQIITTNTAPTLVGANRFITAGIGLASVANAVIVSDANGWLFRVSTTNPADLAITTNTLLPSAGMAIAASGPALYIAAGPAGILTVTPDTLTVAATNAANGEASDAALASNTLYVATGFGGCQAWDVSSPLAPVLLGTFRTGARAVDAGMSASTLFVAADEAGFQVHSLTNPANPEWMTTVTTATNPRCLTVSGSLAYVAEALGGLKIYSITNPLAPNLVGSDPGNGLATIHRLAISGSRVAMTDGHQINLLDVGNPAAPVQLATNIPTGYVFDLAANAANIFAACGGSGLRILDNANLSTVGTFSTAPDPVATVSVNGDYAYIGDGRATFRTLSITNPAAPTLVQASSGPGFGIASAGPLVYLVDGRHQGAVVNVSTPLTPVPGMNMPNLTLGLRVRAQGGIVLTAEDEAGLAIFNASPNDINLNGIPDNIDQQIVDADTNDAVRTIWDVLPGDDFDHDGLSNLAEALTGTSPVDPYSVFAISAVNPVPGSDNGQFVIRWYSEAGKTYTIHKTMDLKAGFTLLQAGIAGTAPINSYTDTVSTATAFYMISVP